MTSMFSQYIANIVITEYPSHAEIIINTHMRWVRVELKYDSNKGHYYLIGDTTVWVEELLKPYNVSLVEYFVNQERDQIVMLFSKNDVGFISRTVLDKQ